MFLGFIVKGVFMGRGFLSRVILGINKVKLLLKSFFFVVSVS